MIFLSGFINFLTQAQQQEEEARYIEKGWDLKEPSTHSVRIMIEASDLDAFCEHLKSLPLDKQTREWTDRNGQVHKSETVSIYLKGSQLSGNYVKLKAAIKTQDAGQNRPGPRPSAPPPQQRQQPAPQRPPLQQSVSPRQVYRAPQANVWAGSENVEVDNDEIPF